MLRIPLGHSVIVENRQGADYDRWGAVIRASGFKPTQ